VEKEWIQHEKSEAFIDARGYGNSPDRDAHRSPRAGGSPPGACRCSRAAYCGRPTHDSRCGARDTRTGRCSDNSPRACCPSSGAITTARARRGWRCRSTARASRGRRRNGG